MWSQYAIHIYIEWSSRILSWNNRFHNGTRKQSWISFGSSGKVLCRWLGLSKHARIFAPYKSSRNNVVRYHMSQFNYGSAPLNKEELFNRYHVSLCSVIERTFGVWKKNRELFVIFQDIVLTYRREW